VRSAAWSVDSRPVNGRVSTRLQIAITVAFAVLLTAGLTSGTALLRPHAGCQSLVIASSQEKAAMLAGFATTYNATAQVAGRCVDVRVEEVFSGDAEQALETGWVGQPMPKPDVWSPASQAWVNLLADNGGTPLLPASYDSLFESPLVIGMPAPMALALGYPTKQIGWADIFDLTKNPQFHLGKTNPTISTSGLHALIGTYFAACPNNLTITCVTSASASNFVGQIETSVVHYGQTATEFLANMLNADELGTGPPYVSAVALEEKELADYNTGFVGGNAKPPPHTKLVPIYPKDGTPVADHPYVVLRWATPQATAVAQGFENFMMLPRQTAIILNANFRLKNGSANPVIAGLLPAGYEPVGWLHPPSGEVLKEMINGWKKVRKPARVLILIDSAVDSKALSAATVSLRSAVVTGFLPQDKVGIGTFPAADGTPYRTLRSIGPYDASLPGILGELQTVNGPSGLEVALQAALKDMASSYDPAAINAVLVIELSRSNQLPTGAMIGYLRGQPADHFVHVFAVGPPSLNLQVLAQYGGGASYDPGSASHFFKDVISNF
jgi:Ca-activated chloride channel family protein